jgi:HAD superfamily hydrolase (TIGR01509 family)
MLDLIKKLRKNYKVYAFSNTNKIHEQVNRKRGLYGYFDDVFLSCNLENVKPDKGIFHKVLKILNLEADEVLFIDDREKNVKVAVEIGMKAIQFKDYGSLIKALSNKEIRLE